MKKVQKNRLVMYHGFIFQLKNCITIIHEIEGINWTSDIKNMYSLFDQVAQTKKMKKLFSQVFYTKRFGYSYSIEEVDVHVYFHCYYYYYFVINEVVVHLVGDELNPFLVVEFSVVVGLDD
jgi:hypothetical protein